ncbi:MAG: hypothetical protein COA57_08710 [Flavobacteriales bacterium]|nr:MAG: hypothetical protein COA57_08710 [Flavobacteriales bacterium]
MIFSLIGLVTFGQVTIKYKIDCDSILEYNEDVHRPIKNVWFMAAVDLINPSNWKNKDTINLSTFTTDNLQNQMPIVVVSAPHVENNNKGEISFSSLIYFEHGEYGENSDSSYYADFSIKNDILILKEKYWWSKGKGREYKFKIVWTGINCCKWIRLNPTKRKMYPKPIKNKDKKKLITVKNY